MPVRAMQINVSEVRDYVRYVFRIGDTQNDGKLATISDLNAAIQQIDEARFPPTRYNAFWIARRYVTDPDTLLPVLVATVSSHHVFTTSAFREEGIALLKRIIEAVTNGARTLTTSGSDVDQHLSEYDLSYLHDAYSSGQTSGYFTLIGVLNGRRV